MGEGKQNSTNIPALLTTRQAAERLHTSVDRVLALVEAGKLPGAAKVGGRWLIPLSEVENLSSDQAPKPRRDQSDHQSRGFWRRIRGADWGGRVTLFITIFTFLVMIASVSYWDNLKLSLIDLGLFQAFPPAEMDQKLIVVTAFDYPENTEQTRAHIEIQDAIEAAKAGQGLSRQNIRVEVYPIKISAEIDLNLQKSQAEEIGERYNASMIIWGSETGVRVTTNFLDLKQPDSEKASQRIEETERARLANPSAYSKYIVEGLPSRLTFLAMFSIGYTYYQEDNYPESIKIIEQAVQSIPPAEQGVGGLSNAYLHLGWMYNELGDIERSIEAYSTTIQLNQNDALAFYNRGVALLDQKKYTEAINDFRQAVELDPQDAEAYINLGIALSKQGEYQQAIEYYTKAIELDPNDALAYHNLGFAHKEQGEYPQAIEYYTKAIEVDPNYAPAYTSLGNAYTDQGKFQQAIQNFEKAIEIDPKFAQAYYNLGNPYFDRGEYQQAIEYYTQAIEIDPTYANAYFNRGLAFEATGYYYRALTDFRKCLELAPDAQDRQEIEARIASLRASQP